jgi:hypothetical protein
MRAARTPGSIVVLYSSQDHAELRSFDCPRARARSIDLRTFRSSDDHRAAETVVITGHSSPPDHYLQVSAERLAEAIACLKPTLVVADTCYGFSSPLLAAVAALSLSPMFVGPTFKLPITGLKYGKGFHASRSADDRSLAVNTRTGVPLTRWRVDRARLSEALDDAAQWSPAKLAQGLVRVMPNLVKVPIPGSDAVVLVPVEPERFRGYRELSPA